MLLLVGARCVAESPLSGTVSLTLEGALVQQRDSAGNQPPTHIDLILSAEDGQWGHVSGYAERFNRSDRPGRVVDAKVTPERLTLKLEMRIEGDPWVSGGRARYAVDLKRLAWQRYVESSILRRRQV